MKIENIVTKQTYTAKDGTEKASWLIAGTLKTLDTGKKFITLNHLPDVTFYVFEQKQDAESTESKKVIRQDQGEVPDSEVPKIRIYDTQTQGEIDSFKEIPF